MNFETQCPTCGHTEKLSDPQRDRYWKMLGGFCRHPKMLEAGIKPLGLHDYLAEVYLPLREVKRPDGVKMVRQSISRSEGPSKAVMSDYMLQVESWAEEVGLWEVE